MKSNTKKLMIGAALSLMAASAPMGAHAAEMKAMLPAVTQQIAADENVLAGTEWALVSPNYAGLEKAPVLEFSEQRLSASVGLNSIGGDYEINGRNIKFSPLLSTKMAGPRPLMNAENNYSKALQSASSYQLFADGRTLVLRGAETLTFRLTGHVTQGAVQRNAKIANTQWELVSPRYAGLEKAPFLKFTDDRLNASVGLNVINGDYESDERSIEIGALLSTKMAGPQPLMNAEDAYSKALQSVRSYQLSDGGQTLTLRGDQTLVFRLTGRTAPGYAATETKIVNVSPQLGPQMDGDKANKYLQLEDLSEGISWGRFSEAQILGFRFVPGNRYQLRVAIERDARSGEKRLRLLEVVSRHWMRNVTLGRNHQILEVAPTKVDCVGVAPMRCLQVRRPGGKWMNFHAPIQGFDFQEGSRYRLQVAVTRVKHPPADAFNLRYTLVRLLDKMPVIY